MSNLKDIISILVEIQIKIEKLEGRVEALEDPPINWTQTVMNFSHRLSDIESRLNNDRD